MDSHNVFLSAHFWHRLISKAKHPEMGKYISFGSSISSAHFQEVPNVITHVVKCQNKRKTVTYVVDNFFAALPKIWCDWQLGCLS